MLMDGVETDRCDRSLSLLVLRNPSSGHEVKSQIYITLLGYQDVSVELPNTYKNVPHSEGENAVSILLFIQ